MTRVTIDGSSTAQAATFNQYVAGDTGLGQVILAYRIYYDGADWQVDSKGSVSTITTVEAGLSWDATDDELDIDLSSLGRTYDIASIPVVSPYATSGASPKTLPYLPAARVSSATDIHVSFYNTASDPAAHVTTESPQMDFCIMILGTETS
jgi:hypothetical protein